MTRTSTGTASNGVLLQTVQALPKYGALCPECGWKTSDCETERTAKLLAESHECPDRLRVEVERLTAALRAIEKIECMEDHDEINEPCPLNIAYDALNPGPTP